MIKGNKFYRDICSKSWALGLTAGKRFCCFKSPCINTCITSTISCSVKYLAVGSIKAILPIFVIYC